VDDFIEIYDDALSAEQCTQIIARFEASDRIARGHTGQGLDVSKKDSYDITISRYDEWRDVTNLLAMTAQRHLQQYVNKYRMLVMGALSPRVVHPMTGEGVTLTPDNFDECGVPLLDELVRTLYRCGHINIQKYLQGSGGYHHWHSEIYPQNATCDSLHRVLLFQFYLNDVTDGGETEFWYQQRKVDARRGRLIIAPAGFTHSHRGNVSRSGDKYVSTSWILFQRAEALFGNAAR
jgi:hypothetical protein